MDTSKINQSINLYLEFLVLKFWSERSACAALGCRHKRSGHSTWRYFSLSFLRSLLKTPEGVVEGYQICAWAPN